LGNGDRCFSSGSDDPAPYTAAYTAHEKPIDLDERGNISALESNPMPKSRFRIINELASGVEIEMQTIAQ
jgi:hypothetical protein